jgi:hypothetical protein
MRWFLVLPAILFAKEVLMKKQTQNSAPNSLKRFCASTLFFTVWTIGTGAAAGALST